MIPSGSNMRNETMATKPSRRNPSSSSGFSIFITLSLPAHDQCDIRADGSWTRLSDPAPSVGGPCPPAVPRGSIAPTHAPSESTIHNPVGLRQADPSETPRLPVRGGDVEDGLGRSNHRKIPEDRHFGTAPSAVRETAQRAWRISCQPTRGPKRPLSVRSATMPWLDAAAAAMSRRNSHATAAPRSCRNTTARLKCLSPGTEAPVSVDSLVIFQP